jgi:ATP-dependent helicase/nuclease subunit B
VIRRELRLVASPRHVERALASGAYAATWHAFVRRWAGLVGRAATPECAQLATALAVEDLADEFAWPSDLSLAQALDGALGSLRRAGVEHAELVSLGKPRARLVARVLERSDEHLGRAGLFDGRAAGWKAAQAIDQANLDDLPARVVVDGLLRWDAMSCAWVEALARRLPVVVRLPRIKETRFADLARAVDVLLSALESRWQHLSKAPDLELHEALVPDQVRLIEASSEPAEARAIVREVGLQIGRGTSAERVSVLLPSLDETLLEPLRAAFDEAELAFAEPQGKPPATAPAVHAALTWLTLIGAPLHRNGVIEWLQSDAVDPVALIAGERRAMRRKRALALVRRLMRMPVGSDPEGALMLDVLQGHVEQRPDDAWMLHSLERLVSLVRSQQRALPRAEMFDQLLSTWSEMGLCATDLARIESWTQAATRDTSQLLGRSLREQSAGLGALIGAGERVVQAAAALGIASRPVSPSRFQAELRWALDNTPPIAQARPGCVRLVQAADIAGLESDVLIVARASEGTFFEVSSDGSVLTDELRQACAPLRRPIGATELGAVAQAELLMALNGAQSLVVTRSSADADGQPLAPAQLFAELATSVLVETEPASLFESLGAALSQRAAELIALGRGHALDDADTALRVAIELERAQFFADPAVPAGAVSGLIVDTEIASHLQSAVGGTVDRPIAATTIERAAQCRFAAFATRVLGAGGDDELGEGLQPWQRGSLIHRALHAAFEAVGPVWDQLPRAEIVARAAKASRDALLGGKTSLLYQAEVARALRDVAAVVTWSLDDVSGFRYAYGERSFGEPGAEGTRRKSVPRGATPAPAWPALVVGEGALRVRVKGRIDRVDLSRDGTRARVLDYKSGAMPAWKDVGTVWFQPALYALAVWQQLGRLSVSEMRALYLDTSRRPPRSLPAEKNQVIGIAEIAEADRGATAIVAKMWRGDVAPRPWHASVCTRCTVRDVCRRPAAMPIEELEPDTEPS